MRGAIAQCTDGIREGLRMLDGSLDGRARASLTSRTTSSTRLTARRQAQGLLGPTEEGS